MVRFLLLLFFIPIGISAQTYKFFISFTDKSQTPFSINNPEQFLSQRSIERRERQNISFSIQDLPVDPVYVNGVSSLGATVFTRSKWFNGITVECDSSVLTQIQLLPYVQSVAKVFRLTPVSNDKFVRIGAPFATLSQLSVNLDYGEAYNQIHLMNGEFLHQIGSQGEGMLIAVLDVGFYNVNQLDIFIPLLANNQIVAVKDFVDNDSIVFDQGTHGTSVLSCIGGNLPGFMIGTAPEASFLLLRSEDGPTENIIEEYNWNAAAEYADSAGADIISSSLSYTTFDDPFYNHSYSDMNGDIAPSSIAADIAASKGIIVVNSAGNSGSSSWHYIGAPADGDSVLAVAAVDSLGRFASFSSYGPASDGAVKPNVAAQGQAATVASAFGGVSPSNGTSFSCPILAGSAACLWQSFPSKSAWEIKTTIERSANYYSAPNDSLGYGIPDFRLAYDLLKHGQLPIEETLLSVYPNPFNDNVSIVFFSTTNQELQIDVFSITGQLVFTKTQMVINNNYNNISLSMGATMLPGVYIIRTRSEGNEYTTRSIKLQ